MRLAVLADIHGNLPALQAVLDDLTNTPVDGYLLAGDYFACPFSAETTRLIAGLPGWKIHGNGELYFRRARAGDHPPAWNTARQFQMFRWQMSTFTSEDWDLIDSLPEQLVIQPPGADSIRLVHGSHHSPFQGVHPERADSVLPAVWKETEEAVFICGHTHEPWIVEQDGRLALNPGAVCGPLDGYVGAEYALLNWDGKRWQAKLCRVKYDINQVRQAFLDSGMMAATGALARCLLAAIETGTDVPKYFLQHAKRLADGIECSDTSFIPDEAWDEAERTFAWP